MSEQDVRWEQRFSNFRKALLNLDEGVKYMRETYAFEDETVNQEDFGLAFFIMKEGIIQRFEYTHELAWNTMKDYALYQGNAEVGGSRDATREAFKLGIIQNGKVWMDMISSRNQTSHIYHEEKANEIFLRIMDHYHPVFLEFRDFMEKKISQE